VTTGTVTAWDPPHRLALTWDRSSEVAIDLVAKGQRVLLTLTQTKLASRADMVDVCGGWHAHLGVLLERLEGKAPASFWPRIARYEREYEERIPR